LDTIVNLALFAGAFFLMMRFGCGAPVMSHPGHGHGGSGSDSGRADRGGSELLSADRDVDPVCGMTVDKTSAKSASHDGQVYYFCSRTCRENFEAAPSTYARKASAAAHGKRASPCC
jgi:YHS domain-containing protein